MKRSGVGVRCRAVVVVLWFVLVATVVAVYELGYQRGQIAALSEEAAR